MIETKIIVDKKPKLKNPVCIVGLPGIGNIGRIAIGYTVQQLKAKKFAELYSPNFFPFVMIHENKIHVLRNEFYFYKGKSRDFIFIIGDTQSSDQKGHYEIAGKILNFLKELGCKEVVTIGGFGTGKTVENPRVFASATDDSFVKDYEKHGVSFKLAGNITTIVGASGLVAGMSPQYGMRGICLLGETTGYPIITDPTAAEAILNVLKKTLKLNIDMKKLDEKVTAMHDFMKKLETIQAQAIEQIKAKGDKKEELKYIG